MALDQHGALLQMGVIVSQHHLTGRLCWSWLSWFICFSTRKWGGAPGSGVPFGSGAAGRTAPDGCTTPRGARPAAFACAPPAVPLACSDALWAVAVAGPRDAAARWPPPPA